MLRRVIVPLVLGLLLLAGCGADPTEVRSPAEVAEAVDDGARLIDVRTPGEVSEGSLATAVVIDAESTRFDDAVAALDPDERYVAYCATGRRAALAVDRMREVGIDVVNGGGYEELAADPAVREALTGRDSSG